MKRKNKILITIVMLFIALVAIDCIIGFAIGGRFKLPHLLIAVFAGMVLSSMSIIFINGKEFAKSGKFNGCFLAISITLVVALFGFYLSINTIGANENTAIIYDTKIESCYSTARELYTKIEFYDKNEKLQSVNDYKVFWIDDETCSEEGAKLTIEEKQGAFKYPIYKILKINDKANIINF